MEKSLELSATDMESLERSARTIVEHTSKEQQSAILDGMERTYLKIARKYGNGDDRYAWGVAMAKTLRTLVADVKQGRA